MTADERPRSGRLLLVPNALDLGTKPGRLTDVIALGVIEVAAALQHWAVEDARSARAFLKRVHEVTPLCKPLQDIDIIELPRPRKGSKEPVSASEWSRTLAPALAGEDLGLLSEAGLPAVADPGSALVAAAHRAAIEVVPLPGPSSLTLAIAASGLNGQSFAFVGYLPQEATARVTKLRELEVLSRRIGQSQLMIETPYRNAAMWGALLTSLAPSTELSVSCALTLAQGWTRSATVERWRKLPPLTLPDRLPAVFALLAH
jgi:16S rRNA (cytidine1402-2'-O)-methyltransferase